MPTMIPTARQKQVLALVERLSERGFPPSLRELSAALRLSGTRAVEKHLAALERKGLLKRRPGARALEVPSRAAGRKVPIVGRVAAGKPMLAEENLDGEMTLDPQLARAPGSFLLRVKGESMKDAGILDGDLVLVRPQPDAEDGEIVVALLDGEATVKRLKKEKDRIVLLPENPSFRPLTVAPGDAYVVAGKVVAAFRTY